MGFRPTADRLAPELTEREQIVLLARALWHEGYDDHLAGHITVNQGDGTLLCNPWLLTWEEFGPDDVIRIDLEGNVLEGDWPAPLGIPLHLELHKARPGIGWALHHHSRWGTVWADMKRVPPIHDQTAAGGGGQLVLVDEYDGNVGDANAAAKAVEKMGEADLALLAHHGVFVLGTQRERGLLAGGVARVALPQRVARRAGWRRPRRAAGRARHLRPQRRHALHRILGDRGAPGAAARPRARARASAWRRRRPENGYEIHDTTAAGPGGSRPPFATGIELGRRQPLTAKLHALTVRRGAVERPRLLRVLTRVLLAVERDDHEARRVRLGAGIHLPPHAAGVERVRVLQLGEQVGAGEAVDALVLRPPRWRPAGTAASTPNPTPRSRWPCPCPRTSRSSAGSCSTWSR